MSGGSAKSASRDRGEGPMHTSIALGRVAGIEIGINWSWLIIFALLTWSLAASVFPSEAPGLGSGVYAGLGAAGAVLLFVSIVLHELGHALQARRDGVEIDGITLWVFGGVARFRGMFPSAGAELRIALAGPLVTLVIAAVLLGTASLANLPKSADVLVSWLGGLNAFLLVFNMLPALPLDGGRVLRALLWRRSGDFLSATVRASAIGRGIGHAMIAGGLVLAVVGGGFGGLWLALIGWFLVSAATAEGRFVLARHALHGLRVSDAMTRHPVTIDADRGVPQIAGLLASAGRFTTYPVMDGGEVAGLLPFRRVADALARSRVSATARDLMTPLDRALVLDEDDELDDAFVELAGAPLGRALVIHEGSLVGLLSITDVGRVVALRGAGTPA